ncbi:MAG: hypothetical protein LBF61_10875 [Azoarcus sp.]|nr:hypothetical protein [Azoarcus sp.]
MKLKLMLLEPKPRAARRVDLVARLAWICLALSVAIAFYWLIWGFARPLPKPLAPDPAALVVPPVAPSAPAPGLIAAIAARPLFLPGRQGQEQAFPGMSPASAGADSLDDAHLIGIASEPSGGVAIVSHGGRQARVRQGEELDGWTLDRVQGNVAYFVRGGEMRDLQLAYRPGQPPPGGGALGAVPPRSPSYLPMPPGARLPGGVMPSAAPGGAAQAPYPYMPPGMNLPNGGIPPYPPGGMPPRNEEAARNAYQGTLRQGTPPPP